ncbi:hypothetical protein [Mangrovimonas sp. YM274]|uniref:hypothetical protein n=1 Tax=Mangrovimonas sp. YM274 TaxID=3070660 RepID=UPI0027DC768C|nr:hypothetical protein [Mangrovimonas sp. YM274]WMI68181.1 hypothetical protein RBH95_13630 [Mangrovimonas sp. YM274]WMI68224.1 hypothetical protein RBH95_13870 [Mangrovimonas sp. YM274]
MTIFPTQKYLIELHDDYSTSLNELQKKTLPKEQFVSNWDKQTFIGEINESDFELKLSKKLYGSFCVFRGKLKKENGILEIKINKTIKIVLLALFLFPIIGLTTSLIKNGLKDSLDLIIPTLLFILILRFVFIELSFRIIAKKGLKKLTEIIGIEKIKTGHNTM